MGGRCAHFHWEAEAAGLGVLKPAVESCGPDMEMVQTRSLRAASQHGANAQAGPATVWGAQAPEVLSMRAGWVRSEVRDLSRCRAEQLHTALVSTEEWKLKGRGVLQGNF